MLYLIHLFLYAKWRIVLVSGLNQLFKSFFEVRLVLWLCLNKCLNLLQIIQHLFRQGEILDSYSKSSNGTHNLWIKECIGQCDLVPKTVFSLVFFEKLFDCMHPFSNPLFGKIHLIGPIFLVDFFKQSQILIRMYSRVNNLTKSSNLSFINRIMWKHGKLWMSLFQKLANGHWLNKQLAILHY